MKRDHMWGAAELRSSTATKHGRYNAPHVATADALIFQLRRRALDASLYRSLPCMLVFGGCAAGLTCMQSNR
jgi:hypothetical protein